MSVLFDLELACVIVPLGAAALGTLWGVWAGAVIDWKALR